MAFRLVSSGGLDIGSPAVVNMRASGVVRPGMVVEFSRTGGVGVTPGTSSSTTTNIFGVCQDYAQGASDVLVRVVPFAPGQIWEADCANSATTAQVGLRHALTAVAASEGLFVHNTGTDLGAGNAHTAIFKALALTGATTGSGKLLGIFRTQEAPIPVNSTVYL